MCGRRYAFSSPPPRSRRAWLRWYPMKRSVDVRVNCLAAKRSEHVFLPRLHGSRERLREIVKV